MIPPRPRNSHRALSAVACAVVWTAAPSVGRAAPVAAAPGPSAGAVPAPTPPAAGPSAIGAAAVPPNGSDGGALAEAKQHFETGLKLFKARVFDTALLEFQEAYRLSKRPNALKNIAQCRRELGQFAEAYDAFAALLRDHGGELKEAEKAEVNAAISDLLLVTGLVDVTVSEPGATITVDGIAAGTSPLAGPIRVKAGAHHIVADKSGFEAASRDLTLIGQQHTSLSISLARLVVTGHVAVREKSDRKITVSVDQREVGPAPWEGDVAPGTHIIEGHGPRLATEIEMAEVTRGARTDVVLTAHETRGTLRVQSNVSDAAIGVDGKQVGMGSWTGELAEGSHRVSVEEAGYQPVQREVVIRPDEVVTTDIALAPLASASGSDNPDASDTGDPFKGPYFSIAAFLGYGAAGYPSLCPDPVTANTTCRDSPAPGYGAILRFGYTFGIASFEGAVAFLYTSYAETDTYTGANGASPTTVGPGTPHTDEFSIWTAGGFVGAGPRLTTKHSSVRLTFGLTPGIDIRGYSIDRTVPEFNDYLSDSTVSVSPALLTDAAVLIGATPGPKFLVGVQAWIDASGRVATDPGPTRTVTTASNVQLASPTPSFALGGPAEFFIGPIIGGQFGR
jgi:hypothetical protein